MTGSICLASGALRQDLHRIDGFRERQAGQFALVSGLLVILRPRSATLMDERMFSRAFSTRRNAAIACTSGSSGSALMLTGTPNLPGMLVWKA